MHFPYVRILISNTCSIFNSRNTARNVEFSRKIFLRSIATPNDFPDHKVQLLESICKKIRAALRFSFNESFFPWDYIYLESLFF